MECAGWTHPVVVVTRHRRDGVEVHRTVGEAVQRMMRLGGRWEAHNGGQYDTLAALDFMRRSGTERLVNYSQGRVTRTTGDGLTLADSFALIPLGLEQASQIGGTPAFELGWPCKCGHNCGGFCGITRRLSKARRAELTAYCVRDCDALWAARCELDRWAEEHDVDLRGTIGGSAWATARRQLQLPNAEYEPAMERRIREAYYGGRAGVYRLQADHLRQWDMVSAYPSALTLPVPVGRPVELGRRDARRALDALRPGVYSATVRVGECHLPPLPMRYRGRIYYPHGSVSGVWPLPELVAALEDGCELEHVHWGVVWPRQEALFATLMRRWAGWRVEAGRESAMGRWLRLLANSLIGKFAERGDRMAVRLHPTMQQIRRCTFRPPCTIGNCTGVCGAWTQLDQWGELWGAPFYAQSSSAHIQWAAYATAYARVAWRREALRHGTNLAYGDCDSVWTSSRQQPVGALAGVLGVGQELGQWELKDTWTDWRAVGVKQYQGNSAKEAKVVLRTAGARISAADWLAGESSQDRGVASLLSAAKTGNGFFVRRSEKWTLPTVGEWVADRLSGDGLTTRAPSVAQMKARRKRERTKQESGSRPQTRAATKGRRRQGQG